LEQGCLPGHRRNKHGGSRRLQHAHVQIRSGSLLIASGSLGQIQRPTQDHFIHAFGRCPIVIHLGDFLQLPPTAAISLADNLNAKNEDGTYKHQEEPTVEVQHACKLFQRIPFVFELQGTKRFVAGDPLIEFLQCMRSGTRFPTRIWKAFEMTFAADAAGVLDPRHSENNFREGYGIALYWETLARWIPQRALRDARAAGAPIVFLQAVDECNST
jgi:hypothetical protein